MRRITLLRSAIVASLFLPVVALAAMEIVQQPDGVWVTHGDDVYATGGQVTLSEPVRGDVFVMGGTINEKARIGGDLFAAGGTVTVDGNVLGDLRVTGGSVFINKEIGGDVIVAGGNLIFGGDAIVGGDVLIAGGVVTVDGTLRGDLSVHSGDVTVAGSVLGDTDIRTERFTFTGQLQGDATLSAEQWYVGDKARVSGVLNYWQPSGERDFTGVARGKVTYDPDLQRKERSPKAPLVAVGAIFAAVSIFSLLSGALLIALLLLATKTFFRDAAKKLRAAPGLSLLTGFLYFLLTPVIVLIFFLTIIGIPLGLLLMTGYVFSVAFSKPLTAIVLAKWMEGSRGKPLHGVLVFLLSVGILIILKLLIVVPFLGWVLMLVAVCGAFGAVAMTKFEKFKKIR
ncbi:hypothetical protein HZA87_06245 [Candidatus Uhrbacteria bacterium]|nr:hypothetical protein [Candidatus Uhrbacteria bacterium]